MISGMFNKLWVPYVIHCLCSLCLLPVINLGCNPSERPENKACIVVGSTHISTDKLKTDMAFISAGIEIPVEQRNRIKDQIVQQCINHYLILEYGKDKGISVSKKELEEAVRDVRKKYTDAAFNDALLRGYVDFEQWENQLKNQILIKKITEKATENIAFPNYQEIKNYFEENLDEFKSPKMVEFRQIVTRTKEEASNFLEQLQQGEPMNDIAREHSIAPEASNGGKVGWIAQGDLNESMENVLFSLPAGKISSVVETPYGYHIFEVLSVRPAGLKELTEVIDEIEAKLLLQKREAFIKKWIQDLRNHYSVKINQDQLNKLELS